MPEVEVIAPSGCPSAYDRLHLGLYAELIDAEAQGIPWQRAASSILGLDVLTDTEAAHRCWNSHLARARWIVGEGLASAIEAFERSF